MKTLVNIVDTKNPLPAFLFVKERYHEGDKLLFIAAYGEVWMAKHLAKQLRLPQEQVAIAALRNEEENHKYEHICRRVQPFLNHDTTYEVNLAGGTRYLCLSVEKLFESYPAEYFYLKTRENTIVTTTFDHTQYHRDAVAMPIRYRMSLREYLSLHSLKHDAARRGHMPDHDRSTTNRVFRTFVYNQLNDTDYETLNLLRTQYRGMGRPLPITTLIHHGVGHGNAPLPHLEHLLHTFSYVPKEQSVLSEKEVDYLTGGWFEQYVYFLVRSSVAPDDIALGVHVSPTRGRSGHDNELDVVFIKNNRLFVIECKSGITSEHLFNEIVYKACALRESLLGMACHSYIFSLKKDADHRLADIARQMNITFCDKRCLTSEQIVEVFKTMQQLSR